MLAELVRISQRKDIFTVEPTGFVDWIILRGFAYFSTQVCD